MLVVGFLPAAAQLMAYAKPVKRDTVPKEPTYVLRTVQLPESHAEAVLSTQPTENEIRDLRFSGGEIRLWVQK